MPIFKINGKLVLFMHVPKTGGTTVEAYLSQFSPMAFHNNGHNARALRSGVISKSTPYQHLTANVVKTLFPVNYFDYVFMIVRDPLQRMISEYRHSRALMRPEATLPFSLWLRTSFAAATIDPFFRNNHFRRQSEFLYPGANIFQFESGLQNCLGKVGEALGMRLSDPVPHERRSLPFPCDVKASDARLISSFFASDYAMLAARDQRFRSRFQSGDCRLDPDCAMRAASSSNR
jgi:hypothetical protein